MKRFRNKITVASRSVIQQDIHAMSDEMLDFTLTRFVAEVRKEDGREYPGKSLTKF